MLEFFYRGCFTSARNVRWGGWKYKNNNKNKSKRKSKNNNKNANNDKLFLLGAQPRNLNKPQKPAVQARFGEFLHFFLRGRGFKAIETSIFSSRETLKRDGILPRAFFLECPYVDGSLLGPQKFRFVASELLFPLIFNFRSKNLRFYHLVTKKKRKITKRTHNLNKLNKK